MTRRLPLNAAVAAMCLACIAEGAAAQPPVQETGELKTYKCTIGSLPMRLDVREGRLFAIVFPDAEAYALPLAPWRVGDPVQVTWTDGVRTLTWSPEVEIRFVDRGQERVCYNGVTHHREP